MAESPHYKELLQLLNEFDLRRGKDPSSYDGSIYWCLSIYPPFMRWVVNCCANHREADRTRQFGWLQLCASSA